MDNYEMILAPKSTTWPATSWGLESKYFVFRDKYAILRIKIIVEKSRIFTYKIGDVGLVVNHLVEPQNFSFLPTLL